MKIRGNNPSSIVAGLAGMLLAFVAGAAERQGDPALTLKGVGINSSPAEIVKQFGTPTQRLEPPSDDVMGMGKLLELHYPGVIFELCQPEGEADFHVWQLTVTGAGLKLKPGLEIGMSRQAVEKRLGPPNSAIQDPITGEEKLHYLFKSFDGWYWFALKKGKVTEIGAAEDWT